MKDRCFTCNDYRLEVEIASIMDDVDELKIKTRRPRVRPTGRKNLLTLSRTGVRARVRVRLLVPRVGDRPASLASYPLANI